MASPRFSIIGNAGSGKSTLARALAARQGLAMLDLDTIVWEPGQVAVARPETAVLDDLTRFLDSHAGWVIEGCYGKLVEFSLAWQPTLVFMNPGTETCLRHCRNRPFEPHKFASPDEQDRMLEPLLDWVRGYDSRQDDLSLAHHRRLFDSYGGPKREITGEASEDMGYLP